MNSNFSSNNSPKTLSAQVYDRIRELVVHQRLKPGTRIDQNQLATDLDVSLVPVREALKTLEAEGLVSIVPRRGAFVTEVSLEHLEDLYFTRRIIEGEAMYHAVEHITEHHLEHLEKLNLQMQKETDARNIKAFMEHNREFHMLIYEAIGSEHFLQTIVSLWERSELYRYRYMFVLNNADQVHAEHMGIIEACRDKDPNRARHIAHDHINNTRNGLIQELQQQLEEQSD